METDPIVDALLDRLLEGRLGHVMRPWPGAVVVTLGALGRERRTDARGVLLSLLAAPTDAAIERLVSAASVPHTSFFRHPSHFGRLETLMQQWRVEGRAPMRVWSAGCASGEEAYSMALTAERVGVPIEILATDINQEAIAHGRRGLYKATKAHAAGLTAEGVDWQAPEALRRAIRFEKSSLLSASATPRRGSFDVIFCRNVLIYFDLARQDQILAQVARFLKPGGYLALAPTESIVRVPAGFRRTEPLGWLERAPAGRRASTPAANLPRVPGPRGRAASPAKADPPGKAPSSAPPQARPPEIECAVRALGLGRSEEAERILGRHLDSHPTDAEAWFLLGEALVERAQLAQARAAFEQVRRHAADDPDSTSGPTLASAAGRRIRALGAMSSPKP